MIAYAVHESGVREVLGLDIGEVESGAFWVEFLRSLRARGLLGVRLCVSDDHEGLKGAIARVLASPWQRCTVHFVRDMLRHCRPSQRGLVSAALREVFNAAGRDEARTRVSEVIARLARVAPKVARLLEAAEEDLIAFYAFPEAHWSKLRSTNPLERVNREDRRRARALRTGTQRPAAADGTPARADASAAQPLAAVENSREPIAAARPAAPRPAPLSEPGELPR